MNLAGLRKIATITEASFYDTTVESFQMVGDFHLQAADGTITGCWPHTLDNKNWFDFSSH